MNVNQLQDKMSDLLKTTCEKAGEVGGAAINGAIRAGAAANNAVTYTRLRLHVADLNNQVRERMCALGQLVYDTHTGNPGDSEETQRLLGEIDALKRAIAEDRWTMSSLRGILLCPGCGSANPDSHVFCQNCGHKLRP